jgi:hypothetical protein
LNTRILSIVLLVAGLAACGGDSGTAPTVTLRTETFQGTLVDPTSCNCGNGINIYRIDVAAAGPLSATATWAPSDAVLILRLMDNSLNTVFAASTHSGTTATLTHAVTPGTYQMQVFLNQGPGRTATFQLNVRHP